MIAMVHPARYEALQGEVETLRERIRQLELAFIGATLPPVELGLTPSEARLFALLTRRPLVSRDMALAILYGDKLRGEPGPHTVDVFLCHVRRKTAHLGIHIQSRPCVGWEMAPASKPIARRLLGEAA